MPYEKCSEVSAEFWEELSRRDPQEVTRRTGANRHGERFRIPFFNRELSVDLRERRVEDAGRPGEDPGFRVCLVALHYLLYVDPQALGSPVSPLEFAGGATFFRGQHGLPNEPLEERFGRDREGFLAAGVRLGAEARPAGDAALALTVLPGLTVEVILWLADEEFPAQASFALPAHLNRFWHLDAVWGLLNVVVQELLKAAG